MADDFAADIMALRGVARKILNHLDLDADRLEDEGEHHKTSLVKDLTILTELMLKLEQVQNDLACGASNSGGADGILSSDEMQLVDAFIARMKHPT